MRRPWPKKPEARREPEILDTAKQENAPTIRGFHRQYHSVGCPSLRDFRRLGTTIPQMSLSCRAKKEQRDSDAPSQSKHPYPRFNPRQSQVPTPWPAARTTGTSTIVEERPFQGRVSVPAKERASAPMVVFPEITSIPTPEPYPDPKHSYHPSSPPPKSCRNNPTSPTRSRTVQAHHAYRESIPRDPAPQLHTDTRQIHCKPAARHSAGPSPPLAQSPPQSAPHPNAPAR